MKSVVSIILASTFLLASCHPTGTDQSHHRRIFLRPCLNSNYIIEGCKMIANRGTASTLDKFYRDTKECEKGKSDYECNHLITKKYFEVLYKCVLRRMEAMDEVTGKIDLNAFKEATIGTSTLSDANKQSAVNTFDGCLVAPLPTPYSPFHYKQENIPERMKKIISTSIMMKNIGELTPSPITVAFDCMNVALLHSECIPSEAELDRIDEAVQKVVEDFNA